MDEAIEQMPETPEELERAASEAEQGRDFQAAHQLFLRAHFAHRATAAGAEASRFCLLRAALCAQKSDQARAVPAVWEYLGDLLGESLNDRYVRRDRPGQSDMFQLMSEDQWSDPYWGYYKESDPAEPVRHRQAWAYLFAARSSEESGDYEQAVREYRKSALAWELSGWGEPGHSAIAPPLPRDARAELRIDDRPGAKWVLAADCYFRAAHCSLLARDLRVARQIFAPYVLQELRIIYLNVGGSSEIRAGQRESDLERMKRCWTCVRDSIAQGGGDRARLAEATRAQAQQLHRLEEALTACGRAPDARRLHRERQRLLVKHESSFAWRVVRWLFLQTTGAGSSVSRTLASATVLYAGLLPLLAWSLHLVRSQAVPRRSVSFWDALLFCLANVVTLDLTWLGPDGAAGEALRVGIALSSYFTLGYVLWLVLRWYGR
jgi:hypothetical protein